MSFKALADYTRVSRYARKVSIGDGKYRPETWFETCDRVGDMHKKKFAHIPEVFSYIDEAIQGMKQKKVLGSQRALQFGGQPILDKELRLFNCVSSYCDRPRFFQEAFFLLLCGCGTGFSAQYHHVYKLPKLVIPSKEITNFSISDTIEGWADSLGILLATYGIAAPEFKEWIGERVEFDYSQIRPEGSPLSTSNGKAPGHKPLKRALDNVRKLLDRCLEEGQFRLCPIDCYDVVMHSSDAVLAGGVRRSATLCLFSFEDEEMTKAKTGNWFVENPQRGRSNNSALCIRGKTSREDFNRLMQSVKEYGEPGFIFSDNIEFLLNPCCFSETTLTNCNGIEKPIVELKRGDKVETRFGLSEVIDKVCLGKQNVINYITEFGSIELTDDHKVYSLGNLRQIKKATHIDRYFNDDGFGYMNAVPILEMKNSGKHNVYDIEVDNKDHSFFANSFEVSNCEIGLYAKTEEGESGWESCNLSEIVGKHCKTSEDFYKAARLAAILGTLQAAYTDTTYLGEVSKRIIEKEALLGVSITGYMDSPEILLNPEYQRKAAQVVLDTNEEVAKIIGINLSARTTTTKPSGTASCLVGTSSGIHPHHARRYIRRVQSNRNEKSLQYFKGYNSVAVEPSVWSVNGTDEVISFPIEVPPGAITKNQLSAIELLEKVKLTKENWVDCGKREELCVKPWLSHNISNTINVRPEEWDDVEEFIFNNQNQLCAVSLLPITGDKDYPQAPFTTVYSAPEMIKYYGDGVMFASGLIEHSLDKFGDLWKACDMVLRRYQDEDDNSEEIKLAYRVKRFADRFFEGDIKKTCYCLKDVYNLRLWNDLKREWVDVDYSQMIEEDDIVDRRDSIACSGNSCEIFI